MYKCIPMNWLEISGEVDGRENQEVLILKLCCPLYGRFGYQTSV